MHVSTTLFDTTGHQIFLVDGTWPKRKERKFPDNIKKNSTHPFQATSQPRSIREVLFSSFPWIVEPMARHYSYLRSLLHAWLYFFNIKVTSNVLSPSTQHEETNQIPTATLIVSG